MVGNSHAFQFVSAIAPIAEARGWRVTTYVAATCTLNDVTQFPHPVAGDSAGCARWVGWASAQVTRGKFDLVITAARLQVGLDTLPYSPTPQEYRNGYISRHFGNCARPANAFSLSVIHPARAPRSAYCSPASVGPHRLRRDTRRVDARRPARHGNGADARPGSQHARSRRPLLRAHGVPCGHRRCSRLLRQLAPTATYARTLVPYIEPALDHALHSSTADGALCEATDPSEVEAVAVMVRLGPEGDGGGPCHRGGRVRSPCPFGHRRHTARCRDRDLTGAAALSVVGPTMESDAFRLVPDAAWCSDRRTNPSRPPIGGQRAHPDHPPVDRDRASAVARQWSSAVQDRGRRPEGARSP